MADIKISELTAGGPAQAADIAPVARSGSTSGVSLTVADVNPDFALARVKPTLQRLDVRLAPTVIRTLFSAPPTVLSGSVGVANIPEFFSWVREAGSAYTLGSATSVQLQYNSVAYDSWPVATLLNGAGPYRRVAVDVNGGGSPYGAWGVIQSTRDDTNKDMTIKALGGDVSGGSGDLTLVVFYRAWPLTQFST